MILQLYRRSAITGERTNVGTAMSVMEADRQLWKMANKEGRAVNQYAKVMRTNEGIVVEMLGGDRVAIFSFDAPKL